MSDLVAAVASWRAELGEAGTLSKEFEKGGTQAWLYSMRMAWVMFAVSFFCPIAETTTVAGAGYSTRGDSEIWTTVFGWERFFVAPFNAVAVYPVLSLLTNLLMLSTLLRRKWLPVSRWPLVLMAGAGVLNMQWPMIFFYWESIWGVEDYHPLFGNTFWGASFFFAALALFIRRGELKSTNPQTAPA